MDKDIQEFAANFPDWRERIQDIRWLSDCIDYFAETSLYGQDQDDPAVKLFSHWSRVIAKQNLEICLEVAESPIERIFLSQVILKFYAVDPFLLLVGQHNPFLDKMKQAFANERKLLEISQKRGKPSEEIDWRLAEKILEESEYQDLLFCTLLKSFGCLDSVIMYPQFSFKGARIWGEKYKTLEKFRADVFFTKIGDGGKHRLIVECDGYKWHKERFTEDRRRDRAFTSAGFETLRFSGTEIYNEPMACALELVKHIIENWRFSEFAESVNAHNDSFG